MLPPAAVFPQLAAACIRPVCTVGAVVDVAHDVGVAPLSRAVAVLGLGKAVEVVVEITHEPAAYCIVDVREQEIVVPVVAPII